MPSGQTRIIILININSERFRDGVFYETMSSFTYPVIRFLSYGIDRYNFQMKKRRRNQTMVLKF